MATSTLVPKDECLFDGNEDIYGLGVRVGIYLQVFTALFLRFFEDKRLHYYRDASLIFMLASFINLSKSAARHEINSVEVTIMMWLLFCQVTVFSTFQPRALTKIIISNIFAYLIELATAGFFLWFWFSGVHTSAPPDCGAEVTFFFGKVNIRNWFTIFQRVFWTLWMVPLIIKPIFAEWGGLFVCRLYDFGGNFILYTRTQLAFINFHRQSICTVIAILSIIACELIIKWNGIVGVNSLGKASQLIPFMIGLGQFVYAYQQRAMAPEQINQKSGERFHAESIAVSPVADQEKKNIRAAEAINLYGHGAVAPIMLHNL